jgi:hypothetical protein
MRYLPFATIFLLLAATSRAETSWERFLNNPTSAHAARVTALTYTSESSPVSPADLQILQNQVLGRDREAFRLAVRLYQAADRGDAEELGVLLGRAARSQPEFFLHEVAALGIPCSDLSWPAQQSRSGVCGPHRSKGVRDPATEGGTALRTLL